MFKTITEGKAQVVVPVEEKISKDLPVFYNPVMQFNRDVSIWFLEALGEKDILVNLPLAGTGVRGIRFLKELPSGTISHVYFNDLSKDACSLIEKNAETNSVADRISITSHEANVFLRLGRSVHYIDLDPFGSPNPFLESAIHRIKHQGILAVTATDTSALCGTYITACKRKYWANPRHDYQMFEYGLRILIRRCQLVGATEDTALIPLLSYSKDHYMRVFFRCVKGKQKVNALLKQHEEVEGFGPLWTGPLCDTDLSLKLSSKDPFLELLHSEQAVLSAQERIGYYHLPTIGKKEKLPTLPRREKLFSVLQGKGFLCSRTHFERDAIRCTCSYEELVLSMKEVLGIKEIK